MRLSHEISVCVVDPIHCASVYTFCSFVGKWGLLEYTTYTFSIHIGLQNVVLCVQSIYRYRSLRHRLGTVVRIPTEKWSKIRCVRSYKQIIHVHPINISSLRHFTDFSFSGQHYLFSTTRFSILIKLIWLAFISTVRERERERERDFLFSLHYNLFPLKAKKEGSRQTLFLTLHSCPLLLAKVLISNREISDWQVDKLPLITITIQLYFREHTKSCGIIKWLRSLLTVHGIICTFIYDANCLFRTGTIKQHRKIAL